MSVERAYNYRLVSEKISTSGVLKPEYLAVLDEDGIMIGYR